MHNKAVKFFFNQLRRVTQ